jgi:hypothetical protein
MIQIMYVGLLGFVFPLVSFAQDFKPVNKLTNGFADIVATLIPLVLALALLFFFWGLVQFIRGFDQGDAALAASKQKLVWGTIVLFVMVSIWGIVSFMQKKLGIEGGGAMDVPSVNIPHSQTEGLSL